MRPSRSVRLTSNSPLSCKRHFKPTVVVVNKWDLAQDEYEQEEYVTYLDDALKGLSYAPIVSHQRTRRRRRR